MTEQRTFDPYGMLSKLSTETEKQLNGIFSLLTNNREFTRFLSSASNSSALFQEKFNKYKDSLESQLNLPTKNDLVNISKLAIQTEDKLDSLEEQILDLQESFNSFKKEIEGIVEVSNDIMNLTKQLKNELSKTKSEIAEMRKIRLELQEMKNELASINNLKEEIKSLFDMMLKNEMQPNERDGDLVSTNTKG
ncbi:polyhydroxyalkanoate biosynthesis repressor PhaR [Neobacillus sp. NRS-1170]|uniref:polyhydroxyalkanoate biosynthesis repressor PhaR n=1 Tax=Neobacillus sp. NRS-1170 TaxID=3233898 RepID=UPI003D2765A3